MTIASKLFKTSFPKIWKEIHPSKNKGSDLNSLTSGSDVKLWWKCSKCSHEWETRVLDRCHSGNKCRECYKKSPGAFHKVDYKTAYPEKAKYWDYSKNKDRPEDFTPGSNKVKWFICEKGHSFDMRINDTRTSRWCGYCSGNKLAKENSFKAVHPDKAKYWDYKKNKDSPEHYTKSSSVKKWFICEKGHSFESRLSGIDSSNSWCSKCSISGYNPSKDGYYYILYSAKKRKFKSGITNDISSRIPTLLKANEDCGYRLVFASAPLNGDLIRLSESENKKLMSPVKSLIKNDGHTETYSQLQIKTLVKKLSEQGIFEHNTLKAEFKASNLQKILDGKKLPTKKSKKVKICSKLVNKTLIKKAMAA